METRADATETESPTEDQEDDSAEEVIVRSKFNHRRSSGLMRRDERVELVGVVARSSSFAISGHRFANGLLAPLRT